MNDQRSTRDQLNDLIQIATVHGMYDAADWIRSRMRDERAMNDAIHGGSMPDTATRRKP